MSRTGNRPPKGFASEKYSYAITDFSKAVLIDALVDIVNEKLEEMGHEPSDKLIAQIIVDRVQEIGSKSDKTTASRVRKRLSELAG